MTKDEALNLALEALEDLGMKHYESTGEVLYKDTFTAIKEALAQPEQEPYWERVARIKEEMLRVSYEENKLLKEALAQPEQEPWLLETTQTLAKHMAREFYPEVTQWQCLDNLAGVISQIDNMTTGLMRKPKQEPVAFEEWLSNQHGDPEEIGFLQALRIAYISGQDSITTPPQRKPLSDEQIILIVAECAASHQHTDIHFARAIERAHGIKELV